MADQSTAIDAWLYGLLANNAVGVGDRVYSDVAPRTATYPHVIYSQRPGAGDVRGVGTARVMTEADYVVKAVGRDCTYNDLDASAVAIDALLNGNQGNGGQVLGSVREGLIRYTETIDGVQYRHLGGIYKIWAQ